jgi:hypothetical protein
MMELKLTGPRGDNPLGFLTALGVLATLEDAGVNAEMRWNVLTPAVRFNPPSGGLPGPVLFSCNGHTCPVGHRSPDPGGTVLLTILARQLRRNAPSREEADIEAAAKRKMEDLSTRIKKTAQEIKNRYPGRQMRGEKQQALEREVRPLEQQLAIAREEYLQARRRSGIDPTVTLGKNLAAKNHEFADFLDSLLSESFPDPGRRALALAASYGVSDPNRPADAMLPTPWALITGAGHQDFLDTVGELMVRSTACHIARAILGPWEPNDERWSLRLDPADDRRYALMASDPTSSGNKSLTLWGANRLAFEAFRFFPAYPAARGRMAVVAWKPSSDGGYRSNAQVRWPLWSPWRSADGIRSLLTLPEVFGDSTSARLALRLRGVYGVFASRRIQVDKYFNLLPGTPVWMS